MNLGFGKEFRLLNKGDFSYLRTNSKRVRSGSIQVFYKDGFDQDSDLTRIGLAVSKKIGKANVRNKIKRIIREYFRQSPYKHLGKDCLIVFLRKDQKLKRGDCPSSKQISVNLENVFKQITQ